MKKWLRRDPESDTGEEWRVVDGYDHYLVSDQGRVWSRRGGRPMQPCLNGNGRPYVVLPGQRSLPVQYLVAVAWHGPRPEGLVIRHLDGDKLNNTPSNLAWGTRSENTHDAIRHGTHNQIAKTHCPQGHPYDAENTNVYLGRERRCRTCQKVRNARRVSRRKAS